MEALFWHRLQFAFTILYHYLFPQLTMGLALIIVILKALGLRTGDSKWDVAARFWIRIFGINFAVGVVTGVPMEFQFGTNWARFSHFAGAVIGQTLGMESLFAFFLESSFLSLLIWGERRLTRVGHFGAALALFCGSWLSGYFIIATNAFMQHPVGHEVSANGTLQLAHFWAFVLNPWAIVQYAHNMAAAVVTASFVVAAVGAYYALKGVHREAAVTFLTVGTGVGLAASVLVAFPTGDRQAKLVARYQPVALAAMEGRFEGGEMAEIVLMGQPNVEERRLDNPIVVPGVLSFLAYGTFHRDVAGLDSFPPDQWPDNIELLYYSFHIMAGLGTLFIGLMSISALLQWRGRLANERWLLWALMVAFPFPYIANTAGWMTTELGRQPWLIYGLMRTAAGASPTVHGTTLFTLLGFCGLYTVLGLLFVFLVGREIAHGPVSPGEVAQLVELWYAIAALFLAAYAVLDGYDLGAGALHLLVARNDDERRRVLGAIGPYWDANEVFLLAAGGVLFAAFPAALAIGLSGFYLAIFLVLWTLILRGIAIEFRSHVADPLWRAAWDVVFCVASATLTILFGAALANLIRGVSIDANGWFALTLFTDFRTDDPVGILDWYTVLVGVFSLLTLAAHGGTFLAWKTDGPVEERSRRFSLALFAVVAALWPVVTWATRVASPDAFSTARERPLAWLGAGAAVLGLAFAFRGLVKRRPLGAFLGSCAFIAGILAATAAMMFPVLLRATSGPARSLTAYAAASGPGSLRAALGWFAVGLPLVVVYFATVFRLHRGKVLTPREGEGY